MTEAAPITTQAVRHEFVVEESEENKKPRKTCWQRFCASCNSCCENLADCLKFWCCNNECYDLCCNTKDVDEDEEAFGNFEGVDDQAAITVLDSNTKQEINTYRDVNEHSQSKPRGDQEIVSGGDDLSKYHSGWDSSVVYHDGGHSGGQHKEDHSGDHNIGSRSGGHHEKGHSGGNYQEDLSGGHHVGGGSGGHHEEDRSGGHHGGGGSGGHHEEDYSGGHHGGSSGDHHTGGDDCGGGNDGGGDCGGGDD